MKKEILFYALFVLFGVKSSAQYSLDWKLKSISGIAALHSYAWASNQGEVVFIGGRKDGLHPKQPWLSFHQQYNNDSIFVVDPRSEKVWGAPLSALNVELIEQLSSSNMQFTQVGDQLILVGGYGYHAAIDDKKTFATAIVVNVPNLIQAVKNGQLSNDLFHRIENENFAVCGGQLEYMNGFYYLVGGHRFDGSYNPKGNPTYVQTYTSAVRKFQLKKTEDKNWGVVFSPELKDENLFRRRDYNLCPSLSKDLTPSLAVFSGVFQKDIDMPYRDVIEFGEQSVNHRKDFTPFFNHYHTAHIELFDSVSNMMHYYFLGGLSEYYIENGELIQDSNVPFTKTVSHVSRNEIGEYREYYFKEELPKFFGSGAQFIPAHDVVKFDNGVINAAALEGDSVLLGYVFGGITAVGRNVFWTSDGDESSALKDWMEVYWVKSENREVIFPLSSSGLAVECYTNLEMDEFTMSFVLNTTSNVVLSLAKINGEKEDVVALSELPKIEAGEHDFVFEFEKQLDKGYYRFTIEIDGVKHNITVFVG